MWEQESQSVFRRRQSGNLTAQDQEKVLGVVHQGNGLISWEIHFFTFSRELDAEAHCSLA